LTQNINAYGFFLTAKKMLAIKLINIFWREKLSARGKWTFFERLFSRISTIPCSLAKFINLITHFERWLSCFFYCRISCDAWALHKMNLKAHWRARAALWWQMINPGVLWATHHRALQFWLCQVFWWRNVN